MKLGKFVQTDTERKRYTIDYSDWLDDAETITSVTCTVTPVSSPVLLVDGTAINPGALGVTFYVSGGYDGDTYKVLVTIGTSGGQTKEDFVTFIVDDPD